MDGHYDQLDFVQENAPERLDVKTKLLAEIDAGTRPHVVIASSSSGIPSSQFISQCTKNPSRILIGHPFNPPHLMPLVEVVPHPETDPAAVAQAMDFYTPLGRNPIHIRQEVPGFVANRLQAAVCSEAYGIVSRGIVSAKDLDACMTPSLGPRWAVTGPLMANAMASGGGSDSFGRSLQHLGPAARKWTEDVRAQAFRVDEESAKALCAGVDEELGALDAQSLERERDKRLVAILGQRLHQGPD
ncbi:hypothetical protein HIM_10381 [Hirsutella minnesotensis 3608]|uniref:3-hydroxyacyl-CoA dehydrogenase NAD binding domain-containing protein n=1 Tax=Hirsutella minnesotensis 3608 TaxID=1043627 RepID=A0A0F7ZRU7_9HYPO|nr:hypothetical protein HIM_10381 [Hirsutella minnesotensis 3608]